MSKKIEPKVPWTLEVYREHIAHVDKDIAEANREMNHTESRIVKHKERKKQLCRAVAKKWEYRRLLMEIAKEQFPESMTEFDERWLRNVQNRQEKSITMDTTNQGNAQEVKTSLTTLRMRLSTYINSFDYLCPSREISLAHTNCRRAFSWLGKALQAMGGENPYKESHNPDSKVIEPTADYGNTSLMFFWDTLDSTQVARVKHFRGLIDAHLDEFRKWAEDDELNNRTPSDMMYGQYLLQHELAIIEMKMWLGWELARIKKLEEGPDGLDNFDQPKSLS